MAGSTLHLRADLDFRVESTGDSPEVSGTVRADGQTIDVFVSAPGAIAGGSSRPFARQAARGLAKRGLTLTLSGPRGKLITMGDVRTSWWQRLVTRSPHIALGGVRVLPQLLSVSRRSSGGREMAAFAPPPTLFPLFPTTSSPGPRRIGTTHDPRGGGRPRLMFSLGPHPTIGQTQRVEILGRHRTTLGSGADCDIRVASLEPVHAVVERTEDDEYVLSHVALAGSSTVAGIPAQRSLLRTGARIDLGGVTMTYVRDEYADHGRPFGGRQGGEIGRQQPQRRPRPRSAEAGRPSTSRDPGQYY